MQWSPLAKVSANILIFLLTFVVSDEVIVGPPFMMFMMRGCMIPFSPTSVRNIFRPQVLCGGYHSVRIDARFLMTDCIVLLNIVK